ncbi:uncharacterized protein LOC141849179 [Brevipalpus obovatus]|uniref:uncharacterized protein LOC141849179 n=1 Tax=Brevipalpus obovatus TaxID=246614 RepID=UPI003D9E89AF
MTTNSSGQQPRILEPITDQKSFSQTVDQIVEDLKSKGIFDQFRKECINDIDTKPAYLNLCQRLEGSVNRFLAQQSWELTMNRYQLREKMRTELSGSGMVRYNTDHLVEQVISQKAKSYIYPQIEKYVREFLGIEGEDEQEIKKEPEIGWGDPPDDPPDWPGEESAPSLSKDIEKGRKMSNSHRLGSNPSLSPSLVSSESFSLSPPSAIESEDIKPTIKEEVKEVESLSATSNSDSNVKSDSNTNDNSNSNSNTNSNPIKIKVEKMDEDDNNSNDEMNDDDIEESDDSDDGRPEASPLSVRNSPLGSPRSRSPPLADDWSDNSNSSDPPWD